MAAELGITDRASVEAMVRLHRAAMRGLAIELSWSGDTVGVEASMELLCQYKRSLTGRLLTDVSACPSQP